MGMARVLAGFVLGFVVATILWWSLGVPCDVLRINRGVQAMRAVATLEIRDAGELTDVQAMALARNIAKRKRSAVIVQRPARAVLRIGRGVEVKTLAEWLENQGVKLIADRSEYASTYTAKLYGC